MSDTLIATTRRREATRQKLMDAAAEVFAEVGLDAASVEAICERAGFTRGAFYSNFESKDELMLALTERVSEQKIDQIAERVRELQATGEQLDAGELVRRILDVAMDQRMGVLLTSEIRVRALRDERLARTYLAWQSGMVERIGAVISDLGRTYGFRLRLAQAEFAQLVLQTWEDTATNAVIAGLDFDAMCALVNDRTVRLTTALIDPV
jgi:AcrR family transcriptional regulator